MKKEKRTFLYEPYAGNGDAVLLYFHKRHTGNGNFDDTWDMTGVDVPTKECPEWSFWRHTESDDIPHDLTKTEMEEIKQYIRTHRELMPRMFDEI